MALGFVYGVLFTLGSSVAVLCLLAYKAPQWEEREEYEAH